MFPAADRADSAHAWQLYRSGRRAEAAAVLRESFVAADRRRSRSATARVAVRDDGRPAARGPRWKAMFLSPLGARRVGWP